MGKDRMISFISFFGEDRMFRRWGFHEKKDLIGSLQRSIKGHGLLSA